MYTSTFRLPLVLGIGVLLATIDCSHRGFVRGDDKTSKTESLLQGIQSLRQKNNSQNNQQQNNQENNNEHKNRKPPQNNQQQQNNNNGNKNQNTGNGSKNQNNNKTNNNGKMNNPHPNGGVILQGKNLPNFPGGIKINPQGGPFNNTGIHPRPIGEDFRYQNLWLRGRLSNQNYERFLDAAISRIGHNDQDIGNYNPGWEQRRNQYQQIQNQGNLNIDQKRLGMDYVKYGDRPLQADEGQVPKTNPVLEAPQAYDKVSLARLSQSINDGIKDDLARLEKALPPGCRVQDAQNLVETAKHKKKDMALLENLQLAIVDRDVRKFERSAEALQVKKDHIQRLMIGLTLDNLKDKIEDGASSDEIRRITDPMVRKVGEAGLSKDLSLAFSNWLKTVPELVKLSRDLSNGTPPAGNLAWPEGDVSLVFDPQLGSGEAKLLPGGMIAASGMTDARVLLGRGNKFTAHGIPYLKGAPENLSPAGGGNSAGQGSSGITLHYPADANAAPLKYTVICFQETPNEEGEVQPVEAWRQDYEIQPGLKQQLELAANGTLWYQVICPSKDGTGLPKTYTLKEPAGAAPVYAFRTQETAVSLVSTLGSITLDNTLSSRPFQFMQGNTYQTIRPGAKITLNSGSALRYARNAKTHTPKAFPGMSNEEQQTPESSDISSITLLPGETGVIGINTNGDWEIRKNGDVQVAERTRLELPIAYVQRTAPASKGAAPAPASDTTPRGNLYVLAVGVAQYKNASDFPSLTYADKDALALSDVLQRQNSLFKEINATVIKNDEATAIRIRTELVGLERKVTKNDTVALILSGHGIVDDETYYFCPHDVEMQKLSRLGISSDELQKVTNNLSARNVFVFLDSCYSGGATGKLQQAFQKQVGQVGNSGVIIFASSKQNESSQEDKSWGHGALTKAFLNTLSNLDLDTNKDSIVQVAELDLGLTEGVKNLTGGGQHVQSAELGDAIRNLSLARYQSK
ncbi:MAG: hypothetical protein U0903_01760 [Planctomycetales bacterium]